MAFPSPEALRERIEPVAAARGMDVEDVRTTKAGAKSQVVVALDSDTHPTLDELEEVSQELSALFDAAEDSGELNFGAGYTLEVTTPGITAPLTAPRHWRRNRGRLAKVGDELLRIGALDEDAEQIVLISRGKKAPSATVRRVSELAPAVVEVEFSQPPAAEVELANLSFEEASALEAGER